MKMLSTTNSTLLSLLCGLLSGLSIAMVMLLAMMSSRTKYSKMELRLLSFLYSILLASSGSGLWCGEGSALELTSLLLNLNSELGCSFLGFSLLSVEAGSSLSLKKPAPLSGVVSFYASWSRENTVFESDDFRLRKTSSSSKSLNPMADDFLSPLGMIGGSAKEITNFLKFESL